MVTEFLFGRVLNSGRAANGRGATPSQAAAVGDATEGGGEPKEEAAGRDQEETPRPTIVRQNLTSHFLE